MITDMRPIAILVEQASLDQGMVTNSTEVAEAAAAMRELEESLLSRVEAGEPSEANQKISSFRVNAKDFSRRYSRSIELPGEAIPIEVTPLKLSMSR